MRLKTVTSTMDVAWQLAALNVPVGTIVVADMQTHGRGRRNRQWESRMGEGLFLSVVLKPDASYVSEITALLAVATLDTVANFAPDYRPSLKWPNDVLVQRRKIAGVLAESRSIRDSTVAIGGIGLNLMFPDASADMLAATSLSQLLPDGAGKTVDFDAVMRYLLTQLNTYYSMLILGETLIDRFRMHLETIGQRVAALVPAEPPVRIMGIAEDIDSLGRLLVRDANGKEHLLSAEQVSVLSA